MTPLKQKVTEYTMIFFLGLLLTSASAWTSGYLKVAKAARYFFLESGTGTLEELTGKVNAASAHEMEIQELQLLMRTRIGEATVYFTEERRGALVSRRTPYKKGEDLRVENLSNDDRVAIIVQVTGDFDSRSDTWLIRVSQDAARALGMNETGPTRVEIRPEKAKN